jgi:AcrR family transcriptional regulator
MPGKKKTSYHHGDLRRALLAASVALIDERGIDALSLRELARRAGVSPAAPYHHFASREQLLAALALDGFEMLSDAMTRARESARGEPIERLRAIGEAYVQFALAHPSHFRLMFRPSLVPARELPRGGAPQRAFHVLLDGVADVLGATDLGASVGRSGLVLLAWSIVHGAAELLLDGPLARGLEDPSVRAEEVPSLVTRSFAALLTTSGRAPAKNGEHAR